MTTALLFTRIRARLGEKVRPKGDTPTSATRRSRARPRPLQRSRGRSPFTRKKHRQTAKVAAWPRAVARAAPIMPHGIRQTKR